MFGSANDKSRKTYGVKISPLLAALLRRAALVAASAIPFVVQGSTKRVPRIFGALSLSKPLLRADGSELGV